MMTARKLPNFDMLKVKRSFRRTIHLIGRPAIARIYRKLWWKKNKIEE